MSRGKLNGLLHRRCAPTLSPTPRHRGHREPPSRSPVREAREECGLEVEVTGLLGLWLDRYPNPSDADRPTTTLNAYYHATAGAVVGRPDAGATTAVGWFEPHALPAEIAFPHHAEAVLKEKGL